MLPYAKADLVLDAVPTPAEIDRALAKLEVARPRNGMAVGFATALPVSIERIAQWAKTLGKPRRARWCRSAPLRPKRADLTG